MIIGISFISTDMKFLQRLWQENNKNGQQPGDNVGLTGLPANEKGVEPFLGGKFVFLDWEKKELLWEMDVDAAAGFIVDQDKAYINNARLHYISVIDINKKNEIKRISNKAFNCLHTIEKTKRGFLVASTGVDCVLEVNEQGESLFEWWAADHGYNKLVNGKIRALDKTLDHREYVYPTLYHTTHLNSSSSYDDQYILTTLFYQGTLIKINRETGASQIMVTGLNRPHAAKPFNDGWIISNTQGNQLCIVNQSFEICDVIEGDFNWVQDNCPLTDEIVLLADANNHRIVEINAKTKTIISEYKYSEDYRIYQVAKIEPHAIGPP